MLPSHTKTDDQVETWEETTTDVADAWPGDAHFQ